MTVNLRGLNKYGKLSKLVNRVTNYKIDLAIITETWLN